MDKNNPPLATASLIWPPPEQPPDAQAAAVADTLAAQVARTMYAEDHSSRHLAIEVLECRAGYARLRMTIKPEHTNGHGLCHGGYQFLLADSAFAYACNSFNQRAVAAGCAIEFLRAAHEGDVLTAEAIRVQQGKRTGVYDIRVTNDKSALVALMRGKSATIKGTILEGDPHE